MVQKLEIPIKKQLEFPQIFTFERSKNFQTLTYAVM